ncbi:M14 family metallopeptidase [Winogradskyella immobilis]|uniref:Peptidase n=1 Tax=Winogradskyella immobilis TaxID=2816852 RepID=A0ABS8EPL7_9FLAO|nr:M14 family metallopeptidase [Winogradskyella immobilis]MCC1485055.1 peptidase [Winogradskyella immobilis]MCG0017147.1 peptidase [Winogradskyella immobilis]
MKFRVLLLMASCFFLTNIATLNAQQDYRNSSQITSALKTLASQHGSKATLKSLTKTEGGNDIWSLTLSNGQPDSNPAIAIVGGVDGGHLLGVELSVQLAENILTNHADILERTTFYIFPNMSPDATAQYFKTLKYERHGNAVNTDDDRDGEKGEDGYEDLNGDNLITMIRVADPTGDYKMLEEDNRIMVKANTKKGEVGAYKLYTEGIDNDKDGRFNEDGEGGIAFNKNMSFNFPYFTKGSGEHPVSEKENRALLDFLYERWNLYSIFTFGPANNLSSPLKYNAQAANKRVVTSILKKDEMLNKFLSDRYNDITKTKDAPGSVAKGGNFFSWSYFHFGKLAMSTPGWWAPKPEADSLVKPSKNNKVNFLRWSEQQGMTDVFVDWKEINHPDFPNQKVEVGGMVPFKMTNPPYNKVSAIVESHAKFIAEISKLQPSIKLQNLKQEAIGNGITRITVDVHNTGLIPTHTEMGDRSRWLRQINVDIKLGNNQELISGRKHQLINTIAEDSSVQLTWLIKGKGSLNLTAGAPHTGTDNASINLK